MFKWIWRRAGGEEEVELSRETVRRKIKNSEMRAEDELKPETDNPLFPFIPLNKGGRGLFKGDSGEEAEWTQLKGQKELADTHRLLALATDLYTNGYLEEAYARFEQLADLVDLPEVHFYLARISSQFRDNTRAKDEYERCLEFGFRKAIVANNLAVLSAQEGAVDAALKSLGKAIQYDGNLAEAHYNLGFLNQHLADTGVRGSEEQFTSQADAAYRSALKVDEYREKEADVLIEPLPESFGANLSQGESPQHESGYVLLERGKHLMSERKWTEAITTLQCTTTFCLELSPEVETMIAEAKRNWEQELVAKMGVLLKDSQFTKAKDFAQTQLAEYSKELSQQWLSYLQQLETRHVKRDT
jgi:tetratricopeptide (TPR) repeat protein